MPVMGVAAAKVDAVARLAANRTLLKFMAYILS
jgi:hypothetical protein